MTAQLIDGKILSAAILSDIANQIKKTNAAPGLAVILVGNDPASEIYVKNKQAACEQVGIHSFFHHLPETVSEKELISLIEKCNHDKNVHGILVQLPLPKELDYKKILECIDPKKDVDGFHPYHLGRLAQRRPLFRSCTPFGVMMLLESIQQIYKNRHAVVVGASTVVGRPMALELLSVGCTVTICHRFTEDLKPFISQADILISAVGKPNLIKGDWIKKDATVIDVGITRLRDGNIVGDIEFEKARERAAWITPVPGGVGPMTIAALMLNTFDASKPRTKE